ncbi:MAG TPA: hypothetical protein VKV33_03260, partial [Streptosporangiaceae bacterium]|nr:hypothetical protein [Streptosporangiaceae bacterium]
MLIHCLHESAELDPAQAAEAQTALARWIADVAGRGVSQCGARLRPVSDAPTVRVRSGDVPVADGPFADDLGGRARRDTQPVETKEQIGGY